MTPTELADMIALADRLLAAGEFGVLSTLFCSDGSTYRRLGSMMVSGPGSILAGGVSGGCVESYVARHGREMVQREPAAMLSFDADPDATAAGKPSLGCGGSIEVLVERLTSDHLEMLLAISDAFQSDTRSTAACMIHVGDDGRIEVLRHSPSPCGFEDLDLEPLRRRVIETEQSGHEVLSDSRRALVHYIPPMTRLVILGAGDDVRPVCTLARSLGWHVTVADRRGRLATRARFPDADAVISEDWANAIDRITFSPRTAVVMMTHSLTDDMEMLPLLANKPLAYVGALGPGHRRTWVLDGVADAGEPLSAGFASRFRGPIGLNLGDRSPAGIAASVIAEILAALNGRDGRALSADDLSPFEVVRSHLRRSRDRAVNGPQAAPLNGERRRPAIDAR